MSSKSKPESDEILSLWQQIEPKHLFTIGVLTLLTTIVILAREELGSYLLGIVLAYLVLPLANRIRSWLPTDGHISEKRNAISTLLAFLITYITLIIVFALLAVQVSDGVQELADNFPEYWQEMTEDGRIGDYYQETVPVDLRTWIDENIEGFGQKLLSAATSLIEFAFQATGSIVSALFSLVIVPIFAVYFLLGRPGTPAWITRTMPESWVDDMIELLRIADRSFGAYTRGVLITSLIVGVITGGGYWLIGVDLWLTLGVIAFAGEVVPIIGPWIAFFVSFPVILVTEPDLAIPALLVFGVVQALEGWFISPKIQGDSIDYSAAATLLALGIGGAIAGPIGVVLALPVAAIGRSVIVYTMRRLEGARPDEASRGLMEIEPEIPPEEKMAAEAA